MDLLRPERFLSQQLDSGLRWDVWAQPKFDIRSGSPECFEHEILVRLRGDSVSTEAFYGAVASMSPDERLPIELHVLQEALLAAHWHAPASRLAINVTPFLLATRHGQRALSEGITDQLAKRLTIEIVEYEPIDVRIIRPVLDRLHGRGIQIALDDYGKGVCCLPSLIHLPCIRHIKLSGIYAGNARARRVLPNIIAAANELGVEATMELVETEEMLRDCQSLGIRYVQGFYLGAPVPIDMRSDVEAKSCCEAA